MEEIKRSMACPGCGVLTPVQQTMKNGQVFQIRDCQNCHSSFGRIVGASGQWNLLGAIDSKGFLISRVARGVKA